MIKALHMEPVVLKAKCTKGVCQGKGCKNRTPGATRLCSTCRSRISRIADPVKYSYHNVKNRAAQRGKDFTITLEEFRQWCRKVRYMAGKGRTAHSYDIDRIDETQGYHIWNIQKLRKDKNIKKFLQYDYQTRHARVLQGSHEIVRTEEDIF